MVVSPALANAAREERDQEPWLLVFDCQVDGLHNCLDLLSNGITIAHYDLEGFRAHADTIMAQLDRFEHILIAPKVEQRLGIAFGNQSNIWRVPHIMFHGYHPDLCYLAETGPLSKGPLGHYHSMIAYAAFRRGINASAAVALFREDVYAALGYFDAWDSARSTLLDDYRRYGFALEDTFARWSAAGPFMHTINHPKIQCLRDLATLILRRAGRDGARTPIVPHDNLAHGPIFPVYPEVGARIGVNGSYLFKPGGGYRLITLEQFVAACFRVYRGHPTELPSFPAFLAPIERTIATLADFC